MLKGVNDSLADARALVKLLALLAQQRFVGRVLDQGVLEDVPTARASVGKDELGRHQGVQRMVELAAVEGRYRREQIVGELPAKRRRELHDALKRRCIYHWIEYPDFQTEYRIITLKVPDIADQLSHQIVTAVQTLRQQDLFKPPGVAETLDWAQALYLMDCQHLDEEVINDTLGETPLTVTFCPLCHTALVFDRTIDGAPAQRRTSCPPRGAGTLGQLGEQGVDRTEGLGPAGGRRDLRPAPGTLDSHG